VRRPWISRKPQPTVFYSRKPTNDPSGIAQEYEQSDLTQSRKAAKKYTQGFNCVPRFIQIDCVVSFVCVFSSLRLCGFA